MYKGYEFKSGVNSFTQKVLAAFGKHSFDVIFRGTGAATDCTSKIYLPALADDALVKRPVLERYCGYILHEVAHDVYTASQKFPRHKNQRYVHQLWNALEDGWIEGKVIQSGVVANSQALFTTLVNGIYGEALDANIDWNDPRQWPFALAVWSRKYVTIRPPVAPEIAKIFDKATSRATTGSADNADIARWVYDQLRKYLNNNPQNQPDNQPDDKPQGQPDDSDDEPQNGSGDSQDGEGESDGDSQGESDGQPQGKQQGGGKGLDSVTDPTAVEPTPDSRIESVKQREYREACDESSWSKRGEENITKSDNVPTAGEYNQSVYTPIATPARLRYELNRLFDGSAFEQHNHGQRAGQVNVGALYRHSFDDAVFSRRQEEEGIDTALSILIDASGSTCGGILESELAAAHAIIDALRGADVKISVDAFACRTVRICDFGEGLAKFKARHYFGVNRCGGSTNDGDAVRYAHRRLFNRPEKRKVLLVLTDGHGKSDVVRESCRAAANLGVTTIGIGIGVDVSRVYPQSIYVDDISQLASVSLKQIELAA
jgi:hypothetical protein